MADVVRTPAPDERKPPISNSRTATSRACESLSAMRSQEALPIDEAVKNELISPNTHGRRKPLRLLNDEELKQKGIADVRLAARHRLVEAVRLAEAAERAKRPNSHVLRRSAAKAVRATLETYANSVARLQRVRLRNPDHKLPMPGANRLFDPSGEMVDIREKFWRACLADGSIELVTEPSALSYLPLPETQANEWGKCEDAIVAWRERMNEWERQGRGLQSKLDELALREHAGATLREDREVEWILDAFAVAEWMEEAEPPARRAWTRLHYKSQNAIHVRTETRVWEAKGNFEAARGHLSSGQLSAARERFRSGMAILAMEFSALREETPPFTGKYDAFFVTFINEFADFIEQVTGASPDPNSQAFETLVVAAHKTLTLDVGDRLVPSFVTSWNREQAAKRHKDLERRPRSSKKGSKTKHTVWNNKIRNTLARRNAEVARLRSGDR